MTDLLNLFFNLAFILLKSIPIISAVLLLMYAKKAYVNNQSLSDKKIYCVSTVGIIVAAISLLSCIVDFIGAGIIEMPYYADMVMIKGNHSAYYLYGLLDYSRDTLAAIVGIAEFCLLLYIYTLFIKSIKDIKIAEPGVKTAKIVGWLGAVSCFILNLMGALTTSFVFNDYGGSYVPSIQLDFTFYFEYAVKMALYIFLLVYAAKLKKKIND